MTESKKDRGVQQGLFDPRTSVSASDVLRYALGDFQKRGFELANRELALDRLLGALKRAYAAFDILPLNDEVVAAELEGLGTKVDELPGFVAKHPYRITVPEELAEESLEYFCSFSE